MRLALSAAIGALLLAPTALAAPLPEAPNCPIFPATSVWNKPVNRLPLQKNSAAVVKAIGASSYVHADFGSGLWDGGPIGIPVTVVDGSQPKTAVNFHYDDESDPGPYPIPPEVKIEGGDHANATATRSSSTRTPAGSTSCSDSGPRGGPARAPSGT